MSKSAISRARRNTSPAARSGNQSRRRPFAKEGLKVSFVNTGLLKFTWPGTEPSRRRPETPEARDKRLASEKLRWDQRMEDFQKAIRCAHIMGCDKVRVFAGTRVADPGTFTR